MAYKIKTSFQNLGPVWVMELYSEVRRCMKAFLVQTKLLETMNRPGLRKLGWGTCMGNKEHELQVRVNTFKNESQVQSLSTFFERN